MIQVILIGVTILLLLFVFVYFINKRNNKQINQKPFPEKWTTFLCANVHYYRTLSETNKRIFEQRIALFISEKKITPVSVDISYKDKLLVAASAIIPVFGFPYYNYATLEEVLIYPDEFDFEYTTDDHHPVLGKRGVKEGQVRISQKALRHGFKTDVDKRNIGIHQFIHFIDQQDGELNGVPNVLLDEAVIASWTQFVHKEIEDVKKGTLGLDAHARDTEHEFLAVIGEYFFERPELLRRQDPELFAQLCSIFHQNPEELRSKKVRK